ncbi:hypothetical protein N9F11_01540 [Akkermansiaceae bacterium]|nr:hypothetical protein [Akkermansiaceae bacterium]
MITGAECNDLFAGFYKQATQKFNASSASVLECDYADIRDIFIAHHYKGARIGGGITQCLAMMYENRVAGGMVLGPPRHSDKYPQSIDIRRMACLEDMPCNSESWFLAKGIKWIKQNTKAHGVLSYSDLTQCHEGTIYKAANFDLVGTTSPTKWVQWKGEQYHPRSLSIDRDYSYKMRAALVTGEAVIHTGKPKKIWFYPLYNRKKRVSI